MREIRVSPDGNSVAIRSDHPEDGPLAWGVMSVEMTGARVKGSSWASEDDIAGWEPLVTLGRALDTYADGEGSV